jgi:signal transduction histidine kinase
LFLGTALFSQEVFNPDSSYTYTQLNNILSEARVQKDQLTLANVYKKLADYEGTTLANFEKAIEYYRRSYEYFKLLGDTKNLHIINHEIAVSYIEAGLHVDAIEILEKLIDAYKTTDQKSLASIYFDLNRAHKGRGDLDKSTKYLRQAVEINKNIRDTTLLVQVLFDKIQTFELGYELDSALVTAFDAFKLNTHINDFHNVARSLFHIGYINKIKKDYPKSIKYLHKSEELLPYEPYSNTRKMIYKELADVYAKNKSYDVAYKYMNQYTLLNDSILNKNRLESYTNLALKYGSQEKKSSIAVLTIDKQYAEERNKTQRKALYVLGGGLLIVLSAIYFIIKFYDQRITTTKIITEQKEEINQQQIRELEDNMKMNSMRSVIEGQETERERIAKDLHDSLGGLLSTIKLQFDHVRSKRADLNEMKEYNRAHKLIDTAVDEVRTISQNLQPSALVNLGLIPAIKDLINRFEGENYPDIDLQYYEMPGKMDKMIALSIYRIIQELLTNSLKHANANEILIQINTEEDELVIQYEDDGVGFDESTLMRKGMGLENLKSRVNYMHGSITMDSEKGRGMSVLIRVKYNG